MTSRERVTRNFIKKYGRVTFTKLLEALQAQESGQKIGQMLGVSRERVRQWRDTFGETVTMYRVYPEVSRYGIGDAGKQT